MQTGADGKPCRVSGCHLDITDRKEAEKERARLLAGVRTSSLEADTAQQQLGNILESISDGFVALDKTWHYTYINRQAASLFGRSPQDLIGKHIWTEFPEGVGQPFHLAYEKAMVKQIFIQMENYYEPWDRWFENRIYPSPNGISIFFHEITERKQAEKVARENAELLKGQNTALFSKVTARFGSTASQDVEQLSRFTCLELRSLSTKQRKSELSLTIREVRRLFWSWRMMR